MSYHWLEVELSQDLCFDINTGCDFNEFQTFWNQTKHRSLGDDQDIAEALSRNSSTKRDLFDRMNELSVDTLTNDNQTTVFHPDFQAT